MGIDQIRHPAAGRTGKVVLAACALALLAGTGQVWGKPGWLDRTSGEFQIDSESGSDPRFSIETVQPLLQAPDNSITLFTQGRATLSDGEWTTNSGLGLRLLSPSQMWMVGVNGWYDRSYEEDHDRWGVGGEIFGPHLTGRVNVYEAISGTKIVSETATTRVEERVVDGFDVELETPVPYLPWARFGVTWFEWDTEFVDDLDGFALELKMDLTGRSRVEVAYSDDDEDEIVSASLRIRLGVPDHVEHTAANNFRSATAFVPRSVANHRLARVERHHTVVIERRTVNKATGAVNGAVVVGRGT